jgi:hypothetical protein
MPCRSSGKGSTHLLARLMGISPDTSCSSCLVQSWLRLRLSASGGTGGGVPAALAGVPALSARPSPDTEVRRWQAPERRSTRMTVMLSREPRSSAALVSTLAAMRQAARMDAPRSLARSMHLWQRCGGGGCELVGGDWQGAVHGGVAGVLW